jgi:hypothetical protein
MARVPIDPKYIRRDIDHRPTYDDARAYMRQLSEMGKEYLISIILEQQEAFEENGFSTLSMKEPLGCYNTITLSHLGDS